MCNREISSRRIDWSFPRSSTPIRGRSPGGGVVPTPPLTVRVMRNALTGRGISMCGAHISHSFSHTLKSKGVDGEARPGFMWLFARMQKATSLAAIDEIFRRLCILALSRNECSEQLDQLQPATGPPSAADDTRSCELPSEAADDVTDGTTYRTKTAFGRHFEDVARVAREDSLLSDTGSGHGASRYFCPALVEYLLGSIMPLASMWSQLISAEVTTNAAVESRMRVVKKQLLKGRTRLPPGDFVRLLLQDTAARVRADLIPSRPLPRGRKRTAAEALLHPEQQQEVWAKRTK